MSDKAALDAKSAVRFSRSMPLSWMLALGASISVGLGVYVLLGVFVQEAGRQALGLPFLLMGAFALPFILTSAERLGVIPGSGGIYNLAHRSRMVWLTYGSGWLLLGGYASLMALLGWGAALHLNLLLEYFFDLPLELSLLAAAIMALMALNNMLGSAAAWRSRRNFIFVGLLVLVVIILREIFRPIQPEQTMTFLYNTNRILSVTSLMVAGWWGLQFILSARDEVHRPTRALLGAMLITVALGVGLGALAGLAIRQYGALPTSLTPLIEILSEMGLIPRHILVILYALFGLFISLIALNQGLVHSLRLAGDMIRDGFLPEKLQAISTNDMTPFILLVLLVLVSVVLIIVAPIATVVGLSALLFLWVTALVFLPEAFNTEPNLPEKRFPKLPFHPLFPWLTIAAGLFLPFYLALDAWWLGLIWLGLGGLYFLIYARRHGQLRRRQQILVGDPTADQAAAKADYVVLVGVANPKTAPALLQAGARLAQARHGLLLVLKVLPLAEQIPDHLKQQKAQREWESLSALVQQVGLESAMVKPLVLLAPNPAAGILEAASDQRIDLLLLGWEGEHPPGDTPPDPILDPVIKRAPCSVAILRGSVPEVVRRVLVPTAGGPYAPAALALGRDLVEPTAPEIVVEHMVEEHLTPEREAQAKTEVGKMLETVRNGSEVKGRVVEVDHIQAGIIEEAKASDLLLIGASRKGYPERPFFGGLATDVATAAAPPTILTRGREAGRSWWQRLWEILTDWLPTLTVARQVEVYQNMRESAQPSIDFFVLITLAAVIASLGLLQNSGAVIIGAMLVAPLMSPILAMAMSMVHGNPRLLLVAAGTTAKGITLAIIVGLVVVIISPIETATNEILARTAPNILDLIVALASGAAAGYAISRKEVAAALPGVAIAAALVPPLCVVGYGLGTSQLDIAAGSLLLFTTNLIAIILAAGLTFLALGFHPTRSEQQEVLRGFKVTAVFYSIIFIILALTTVSSVTKLNREASVEAIFTDEVVARAGEVREMTIERDGNGFIVTATIIDIQGNQLTSAEITDIQAKLTQSVGGPVSIRATVIPGTRVDFTGFDLRRELEDSFRDQITEQGALVAEMRVDAGEAGFDIIASVISFEEDALTDAALAGIQADLSETMEAPVNIQAAILPARQVTLESPSPAQPNAGND